LVTPTSPYSLPQKLESDLAQVLTYWEGLKRGEADMPFWDDVSPSALPDLTRRLMLLEVFEKPVRFRFGTVGADLAKRYGKDFIGKFIDEIAPSDPLQYLGSQASATIEKGAPTYFKHQPIDTQALSAEGYARLLLPLWGDGHIGMLLGAITEA